MPSKELNKVSIHILHLKKYTNKKSLKFKSLILFHLVEEPLYNLSYSVLAIISL